MLKTPSSHLPPSFPSSTTSPPAALGDREWGFQSVHHELFLLLLRERSPLLVPAWGPSYWRQYVPVPKLCLLYTVYMGSVYRYTPMSQQQQQKKLYCFLLLSFFVSNKRNLPHTGKKNSNSSCPISSAMSCLKKKFNCYFASDPFIVLAYGSFLTPKMSRGE